MTTPTTQREADERAIYESAEKASLKVFPHPNSPHTSVNMRVEMDRAAYKAGYIKAARAAIAQSEAHVPSDKDIEALFMTHMQEDTLACGLNFAHSVLALTQQVAPEAPATEQKCVGCEGKPSGSNNPCAVCGLADTTTASEQRGKPPLKVFAYIDGIVQKQIADALASDNATTASASSLNGYLNDDCDAPMVNGACSVCGFGPCRRATAQQTERMQPSRETEYLTDEQIDMAARKYVGMGGVEDYRAFARDITALARTNTNGGSNE